MNTVRLGHSELQYVGNAIATVGTFDGVHCGHRGIIQRMRAASAATDSKVVVVTFDPHPQIVLQKPNRKPLHLLTTIEERLEVLEQLGVDLTVVIPFTTEFAATPPEQFVRDVLAKGIGVASVFVGHDHMFGKDRAGNEDLLRTLGSELGFSVVPVPPLECDGIVVSSTKVRDALYTGNVMLANHMLGRAYSYRGTVVKGDGRGRTLGVPTANVSGISEHKLLPAIGVYVVTATVSGVEYQGVASIGVRPTFTTDAEPVLEVHLLDTDANIYHCPITVSFLQYLRPELRFDSAEALMTQMKADIKQTQTYFQTLFVRTSS